MRLRYLIALFVLFLLIVVAVVGRLGNASQGDSSGEHSPHAARSPARLAHAARRERPQRGDGHGLSGKLQRARDLEILKEKWLKYKPGNAGLGERELDERDVLAVESVRKLLFSPELLELEKFLEEHDIYAGRRGLKGQIKDLVLSDLGDEVRLSMLELAGAFVSGETSADWQRMESLAAIAGAYCSDSDFAEYHAELQKRSERLAQEALLKRNLKMVPKGPDGAMAALESTMDQLGKGIQSGSANRIIGSIVSALPAGSDYGKSERMLEDFSRANMRDGKPVYPVRLWYRDLSKAWARGDPSGAARHVLANPDKYPIDCMETIGNLGYLKYDQEGKEKIADEWIQSLPPGPARDQVAAGAARYLIYHDVGKARRMAESITDEVLKRKLLPWIEGVEKGGNPDGP